MKRRILTMFITMIIAAVISIPIIGYAASKPGKIVLESQTVLPEGINLHWKKVSGASKYEVWYKRSSDKNYTKAGYTSSLDYSFRSLKNNTTYCFKVRAINSAENGPWNEYSIKFTRLTGNMRAWWYGKGSIDQSSEARAQITEFRIKPVTNAKLNNRTLAATGYQLAEYANKKYKHMYSIQQSEDTKTTISSDISAYCSPAAKKTFGTRFYYRYKASSNKSNPNGYIVNYFSSFINVTVNPVPYRISQTPRITKRDNKITIKWTKPKTGCDGYRVYYSSRNTWNRRWTDWSCWKTIEGVNKLSATYTGNTGNEYSFRVVPFSYNNSYDPTYGANINETIFSDAVTVTLGSKVYKSNIGHPTYYFPKYDGIILVGDSRTAFMTRTAHITDLCLTKVIFIGNPGSGYKWLVDGANTNLLSYLNSSKKYIVVFNHGVNDLGNLEEYKKYYESILTRYKNKHKLLFMSVNPVVRGARSDRYYNGTGSFNERIKYFNLAMKYTFGANRYIDCYNHLMTYGYDSYDGIHFTDDTNLDIINYIMSSLKAKSM